MQTIGGNNEQPATAVQARAQVRLEDLPGRDRLAFWVDQVCAASAKAECEIADRTNITGQLSHLSIADLRINEMAMCAQSFRRTSYHLGQDDTELFAILLQRTGSSTIGFNGAAPQRLLPGDVSINTGLQQGVWKIEENADVVLTVVPSALMRQVVGFAHEHGAAPIARGTPVAHLVTLFLDTLLTQADTLSQASARCLRDGLLQTVAAALDPLATRANADETRLAAYHRARIQRFFMQHLHDTTLDMERIARGVQLSASQIHRLFAAQPGGGVMHRVWRARLDVSRKMIEALGAPLLSIAEVGWRSGFQSASHFSRSFKEHFGASPSEWRASAHSKGRQAAPSSTVEEGQTLPGVVAAVAARVESAWLAFVLGSNALATAFTQEPFI